MYLRLHSSPRFPPLAQAPAPSSPLIREEERHVGQTHGLSIDSQPTHRNISENRFLMFEATEIWTALSHSIIVAIINCYSPISK